MKSLIPGILFLVSCNTLFAQGLFLKKGESGVGLLGQYLIDKEANGFGISPAFSYKGYFDISLSYAKAYMDEELPDINGVGQDFTVSGYGAMIAAHVLKETEKIPFTLSLTGHFGAVKSESEALESISAEAKGSSFGFGLGLSKRVDITNTFNLVPVIDYSFGIVNSRIDFDNSMIEDFDETSNVWDVGLKLGLQHHFNDKTSVLLMGGTSFDDEGDNSINIGLGAVYRLL